MGLRARLVLLALVWAAVPGVAGAQSQPGDVTRARELFVDASELRDRGDLKGALEKFQAAHALAANPITTFELARTYAALGMRAQARDAYASIAALPVQPNETERAAAARRDGARAADELAAALATPAATPPAAAREGEPREVDPAGARAPAAPPRAPLHVDAPPPADTPPPPPAEGSSNHLGPVAWAGFGVGAAGFATGTILAAATLSKASSIVTNCSDLACEQATKDAAGSARDLGTAAVVAYTVGFVAVGVGFADLILHRRPDPSAASDRAIHPWIGVGAAGLRGSF